MDTHFGDDSNGGTSETYKIRAAVQAAVSGQKLPLAAEERMGQSWAGADNMPTGGAEVSARELSADAPSNPFPGVPVIVAEEYHQWQAAAPAIEAPVAPVATVADLEPMAETDASVAPREADTPGATHPDPFSGMPDFGAPAPGGEHAEAVPPPREESPAPVVSAPAEPLPDGLPSCEGLDELPVAAVPGTENPPSGIDAPLLLRPGSGAAGSGAPVNLTAVPGTSVPEAGRTPIPISEIAARAAEAMESVGDPARPFADGGGTAGSPRPVPMLGELSAENGTLRRNPSHSGGDGTGEIPHTPAPDSGFRITNGLMGLLLCGVFAGTLAWFQMTAADETEGGEGVPTGPMPTEPAEPASFVAKLTESDLFAVDAEWVKNATFTPISAGLSGESPEVGGLADIADPAAGGGR
ncbi:MAG: hypothetical protein HKN82_13440 [Akkermansiaceae bacterium]|nr:hypothetical protein [Akkermansiaceae bacterium]NNM28671.1 hypothetical protein [Akkermansiaceae bacterium]